MQTLMQKYIMEMIGSYFLTVAITLTGNPLSIGFMLAAMIFIGGHISGAHCNPVVSLAMFLRNKLKLHDMIGYMAAQLVGALCALLLFNSITGTVFVPDMAADLPLWISVKMELILTFVFCWVVITVLSQGIERGMVNYHAALSIGFTLMAVGFVGGLLNPAVGLATMIVNIAKNGTFTQANHALIYVISPLMGSIIAAYCYRFFNENNR